MIGSQNRKRPHDIGTIPKPFGLSIVDMPEGRLLIAEANAEQEVELERQASARADAAGGGNSCAWGKFASLRRSNVMVKERAELFRVVRDGGHEDQCGDRASEHPARSQWKDSVEEVNGGGSMKNRLINITELSQWLGVAVGTLYNWVYQERIPFKKLGRCLRFAVDEIEEWLRNRSTLEEAGRR
jgi:excisionase family DNA binding protein